MIMGVVLARCPRAFAGHTCSTMNWAIGFRQLGWDVWLTEAIPTGELEPPEGPGLKSPQEEHWQQVIQEFGFENQQCLIVDGKSDQLEAFREFASEADLFINYSGQYTRLDLMGPRTVKAYLDVDPAFTQLWVDVCQSDMNFAGHDVFLTVGTTLNQPSALVPGVGIEWLPVPPPVVGSFWRAKVGPIPVSADQEWNTIAHWYGYHELEWQGRKYGGKRESMIEMRPLPKMVKQACALATDLAPDWDDYASFADEGWKFHSAAAVCNSVTTYLNFIASSRAEIGICKSGYVVSRGGWMSDRSVVYLALGKPVLLQDTAWPQAVPPGPGLLPFTGLKDCAARIAEIEADYAAHAAGARHFADDILSAEAVLTPLLSRIL